MRKNFSLQTGNHGSRQNTPSGDRFHKIVTMTCDIHNCVTHTTGGTHVLCYTFCTIKPVTQPTDVFLTHITVHRDHEEVFQCS